MGCVIFAIILLVLGGVAIAFDVSIWGAILILLGILVVIGLVYLARESLKSPKGKQAIGIISLILVIAFCLFVLVRCFSESTADDGSWERCLKCGGDGKVVNDLGFNVSCPRCNGVGYLP